MQKIIFYPDVRHDVLIQGTQAIWSGKRRHVTFTMTRTQLCIVLMRYYKHLLT